MRRKELKVRMKKNKGQLIVEPWTSTSTEIRSFSPGTPLLRCCGLSAEESNLFAVLVIVIMMWHAIHGKCDCLPVNDASVFSVL